MGSVTRMLLFKKRIIILQFLGGGRKVYVLSGVKPGLRCEWAYRPPSKEYRKNYWDYYVGNYNQWR